MFHFLRKRCFQSATCNAKPLHTKCLRSNTNARATLSLSLSLSFFESLIKGTMYFFHTFNRLLFLLCLLANKNHAAPAVECIPFDPNLVTRSGPANNLVEVLCATVYVFDNVTFSGGSSELIAGSTTLLPGGPSAIISRHTFSLVASANSIAVDRTLTPLSPPSATQTLFRASQRVLDSLRPL